MMGVFTLTAFVLGSAFFHDPFGLASQGGDPMNVTSIKVDHVRTVADKPFDQVVKAFERQLGQFDPEVYKSLAGGEDPEKVRPKSKRWWGRAVLCSSGLATTEHCCAWPAKRKRLSSIWLVTHCSPSR